MVNYLWDNIFHKGKKEGDLRTVLHENILFQDLNRRELKFVENIIHVRHYRQGEIIFRQSEVGVGMYIIIKGRVEILISDYGADKGNQREIFITQLSDGDFFGELSLVEENGRRTATAVSQDDTALIGFFKPDLMEILARRPSTGVKIVYRLAEVLGRRLKDTTDKVSELRRTLKELRSPPPMSDTHEEESRTHTAP